MSNINPIIEKCLAPFAPDGNSESDMVKYYIQQREGDLIRLIKEADEIEKEGLNCPNCPNQGYYISGGGLQGYVSHEMVIDGGDRSLEGQPIYANEDQCQCEFCYTEPNSKFNLRRNWRADQISDQSSAGVSLLCHTCFKNFAEPYECKPCHFNRIFAMRTGDVWNCGCAMCKDYELTSVLFKDAEKHIREKRILDLQKNISNPKNRIKIEEHQKRINRLVKSEYNPDQFTESKVFNSRG